MKKRKWIAIVEFEDDGVGDSINQYLTSSEFEKCLDSMVVPSGVTVKFKVREVKE